MAWSDYTAALDAFYASPSVEAKRLVLTERAQLPSTVSVDGTNISLPSVSELNAQLGELLDESAATDPKRFIRTRMGFGGH